MWPEIRGNTLLLTGNKRGFLSTVFVVTVLLASNDDTFSLDSHFHIPNCSQVISWVKTRKYWSYSETVSGDLGWSGWSPVTPVIWLRSRDHSSVSVSILCCLSFDTGTGPGPGH